MADLVKIYLELSMTSVFRSVLKKPLFQYFFEYSAKNASKDDRINSYAQFVSEIYLFGGSLTELVKKFFFEY